VARLLTADHLVDAPSTHGRLRRPCCISCTWSSSGGTHSRSSHVAQPLPHHAERAADARQPPRRVPRHGGRPKPPATASTASPTCTR
jgi:hypothetical protein